MKIRPSVSLLALATASLAMTAPAHAQSAENDQTIIQADEETRQNSTAKIEQSGDGNLANGNLNGISSVKLFDGQNVTIAPNGAGIYQDGSGSTSTIDQFGTGNAAAINQADSVGGGSDSSTAVISQGESGNRAVDSVAYISQAGDSSTVRITQKLQAQLVVRHSERQFGREPDRQ